MFSSTDLDLIAHYILTLGEWSKKSYEAPSPPFVKEKVLLRNGQPNATWVETGTFMGTTTQLLAQHSKFVFSIEPEPNLYANAAKRFEKAPNVKIINGLSEAVFPDLLPTLSGDVNFWLDGHYSAGVTHKGPIDTPIVQELECIEKNRASFSKLTLLIDDIRCFDPSLPGFSSYPSLNYLVDWARRMSLYWHIEHDIFIATNTKAAQP